MPRGSHGRGGRRDAGLAVGLVLLPPAAVARRAIAKSRALDGDLRLGPRARPHITLAMGCVDAEAIAQLAASLRELAQRTAPFEVVVESATAFETPRHVTAWYTVRRTRALATLHRACVRAVDALPHRRATPAAFIRPRGQGVSASAIRWVARYSEDAAFARYRPHITLGYGRPEEDPALPVTFTARRLALCHLGSHCTCAKILAEARLGGALSGGTAGSPGRGPRRGRGSRATSGRPRSAGGTPPTRR
jgi:2'-5' RNA ligase